MIVPVFKVKDTYRLGLIVPSSNVTMEIEIPTMLRAREILFPDKFSFHSARVGMREVTPAGLRKMNARVKGIMPHLLDAQVDIILEACLVAAMQDSRDKKHGRGCDIPNHIKRNERTIPVLTSAEALIEALKILRAHRIALIAPYTDEITAFVIDIISDAGIYVADSCNLCVSDNCMVGKLDPENLISIARTLKLTDVDALVISACVQMPSLSVINLVESEIGIPVLSASTATTFGLLKELQLETKVPGAGTLLSGKY